MSVLVSGSQEIDTQREDHEMAEGENGHRHTKGRLRRSQPRQRRDLGLLACRTVRNLICCLSNAVYFTSPWQPLVAQTVKNQPAMQETWVRSLGWEDPLEESMATHSSVLAWRIPWTEEPEGLQSIGSQRVEHD